MCEGKTTWKCLRTFRLPIMETPVLFFQGEEHSSLSDLSEPSSAFIKKTSEIPASKHQQSQKRLYCVLLPAPPAASLLIDPAGRTVEPPWRMLSRMSLSPPRTSRSMAALSSGPPTPWKSAALVCLPVTGSTSPPSDSGIWRLSLAPWPPTLTSAPGNLASTFSFTPDSWAGKGGRRVSFLFGLVGWVCWDRDGGLTGVGEGGLLGAEVALGLFGDDHGVLTFVCGRHCGGVVKGVVLLKSRLWLKVVELLKKQMGIECSCCCGCM